MSNTDTPSAVAERQRRGAGPTRGLAWRVLVALAAVAMAPAATLALDPLSADTDRDGRLDGSFGMAHEAAAALDPLRADTDGDSLGDAFEF